MALLKFFKVPKHRKFEYKPRHWNPDQEEMDKRLERIKEIQEKGVSASKARISGSFRKSYKGNSEYRKSQIVRSNFILLGVIVLLLVVTIYFMGEFLPSFTEFIY